MAITHAIVMLAATLVTSWDALVLAEELPPYLNVCSRNDSEFSACLRRAVMGLQPILVKGDPDRGVPSLEPLELGDLLVAKRASNRRSRSGVSISATDILAYGASNFQIGKISGNFDKLRFFFEVILPRLETTGMYKIDGEILGIPLEGSGPFTGNFTNCVGYANLTGEIVERNGEKHVNFTDLKIQIKVGKGRLHLKNLFGGNKALGSIINHTINSNFGVLSKDIIPLIEDALGKLFVKVGNKIVEPFTVDQLYPESQE